MILSRNDSEESDDIPSDVDLSDPYFREEIDAGLSNVNNKGSAKTSKKRKWEVEETEEDKKAKVSSSLDCFPDGISRNEKWQKPLEFIHNLGMTGYKNQACRSI